MYSEIKAFLLKPLVPLLLSIIFILWTIVQVIHTSINIRNNEDMIVSRPQVAIIKTKPVIPSIKRPLFGDYVPENLNETTVKESMLNLHVVGVLFSKKEEDSQVIIRTASGEEHTYKIGDTLPGSVIIKRITPEGVLLGREGGLESLSLPKNPLNFQPQAKPLEEDKL
ncbi:general secretion pathway protein C (plasmid) [Legionella adelaidensis]|uniref:General secretion pathway protein C n=1 Tax=Legionella adelaidensis TaxID=45056 RepID=A0A0W0R3X3_9GAMM|nr:type II secretion system protein N [Legionella adelaidensis]KTC65749.1 general secretion pathway protein C [Legionella adelaidensis]VEH85085.1 general secretion pathway protein C [Legionella adelaidensis]